jgi:hypothetical protein
VGELFETQLHVVHTRVPPNAKFGHDANGAEWLLPLPDTIFLGCAETMGILHMRQKATATLGKRRNRIFLFAMLCLVFGGCAYVLYPAYSPTQAIGGIYGVAITTPSPVSRVSVDATPDFSHNRITFEADIWSDSKSNGTVGVQIILPKSAWPRHVACPKRVICGRLDTGEPVLNMSFPAKWTSTNLNQEVAFITSSEWEIPNIGLGIARNPEYISIIRPAITVYSQAGTALHADTTAVIQYWLNLHDAANYAWDAGNTTTAPFTASDSVNWIYPSGQLPTDPFDANAPPILDSGTNLAIQSEAERNLFISGILLGIAGGVLIAAIQDLISVGMESRRSEGGDHKQESRVDYPALNSRQDSMRAPSPPQQRP